MEAENLGAVDVTRVFTLDAVLPIQVAHQPADRWLQRLCLAVLDDALKCLEGRLREKRKAWEWVYCLMPTIACPSLPSARFSISMWGQSDDSSDKAMQEALYRPACPANSGNLFHALLQRSARRMGHN